MGGKSGDHVDVRQPSGSQAVRTAVNIETEAQPSGSQAEGPPVEQGAANTGVTTQQSYSQDEIRLHQGHDLVIQASGKHFKNNLLALTKAEPRVSEVPGSTAVVTELLVSKPDEQLPGRSMAEEPMMDIKTGK